MESAVYVQGALKRQLKSPWLPAVLSTCCPGNRRQGKQDLSDGKCQLQADLESRKRSGEERGGRARRSLLPTLTVPLPLGRLLCEGEGLFPEWREGGERRLEAAAVASGPHCFRGDLDWRLGGSRSTFEKSD